MSVVAPEGRILVREALPALGQLAAFLFVVGCIYVIDAFVRALFGTVEGAIGWIPFAGKVAKRSVQKIEQKITHSLGTAEQAFDKRIGASFHKLAHIVRSLPGELLDQAKLLFGLAVLFGYLLPKAVILKLIRAATMPVYTAEQALAALLRGARARLAALGHLVRHSVWAWLAALAALISGVLTHDLPHLRARERALTRDLARLWKWVRHRKLTLTTGAFLGAFVWALGKLGLSWIRCSNVGKVGRSICRLPSPVVDALIAGLLAELALANLRTLAQFAQDAQEEVTHELARLVGLELPVGRFTVE